MGLPVVSRVCIRWIRFYSNVPKNAIEVDVGVMKDRRDLCNYGPLPTKQLQMYTYKNGYLPPKFFTIQLPGFRHYKSYVTVGDVTVTTTMTSPKKTLSANMAAVACMRYFGWNDGRKMFEKEREDKRQLLNAVYEGDGRWSFTND